MGWLYHFRPVKASISDRRFWYSTEEKLLTVCGAIAEIPIFERTANMGDGTGMDGPSGQPYNRQKPTVLSYQTKDLSPLFFVTFVPFCG